MANSLVVIDDRRFRASEINKARAWLKKIEKLDEKIRRFHNTDQRLFGEWHDITFRDLNSEIAVLRAEFRKQAEFHNEVLLLAKSRHISFAEAFQILWLEEREYKSGDALTKARIDEVRRLRGIELEKQLRQEEREEEDQSEPGYDPDDVGPDEHDTIYKIQYMEPEEIRAKLNSGLKAAIAFLFECIPDLVRIGRMDLIRKIWDVAPDEVKAEFNRQTKKAYGASLDEVLDRETEDVQQPSEKFSIEDKRLQIKSIFRKIARRIHPDRKDAAFLAERKIWVDSVWKKAVRAHEMQDLAALTHLYHQILLVFGELDSMSLAELRSAVSSIEEEFFDREDQARSMKSSPAWNFSRKKSYSSLLKRVEKPFHRQRDELLDRIEQLKSQRELLEDMLESGADFARPKRKSRGKKRRGKGDIGEQMSFGI